MAGEQMQSLYHWNERIAIFVQYLVASLMLACLVVTVVQLGEYLMPSWNGAYLVVATVLVALEAMYAQRRFRYMDMFQGEWLKYRAAEVVLLLVGLKLALYARDGFDQLLADLPRWRHDFGNTFFTGEYMFAMLILLAVWVLAGILSAELVRLEGDERILKIERDSGFGEERAAARRSLAELILVMGGIMVFIVAMMRLDWAALWGSSPPAGITVLNVLAYFILALILLSLTQFSILRARWSLNRIPIHHDLARNWILYSGVFLVLLAAVAFILPTGYSVGLLQSLSYLISLFFSLIGLLLMLLLMPLFMLYSFLGRFLSGGEGLPPPDISDFMLRPPPAESATSFEELLKSLLFWALFIGIIAYSLYHFVTQNKELMEQVRRRGWLMGVLSWLRQARGWLVGVNRSLTTGLKSSWQRLRSRRAVVRLRQAWHYVNLKRLPPRQQVFFFYLAMLRRSGERGLPRHPAETPYEYARTLQAHLPGEVEGDVSAITEEFMEARYSRHEISAQDASLVQTYWEHIRRALRRALGGGSPT